MTKLQTEGPGLTAKEAEKLLRKWDWVCLAGGSNHARWRKNGVTITVRRQGNVTWEPIDLAAKEDGLHSRQWLKGPPEDKTKIINTLTQADVDWYINHDEAALRGNARLQKKLQRIRGKMKTADLLSKYDAARLAHLKNLEHWADRQSVEPIVPLDTHPDPKTGYITLADALSLRKMKEGTMSRSSCGIIAALAISDIVSDGKAAQTLLGRINPEILPKSKEAINRLINEWEKAGLLWREMKHQKATNKMGLTQPVDLTEEQKAKYLNPDFLLKLVAQIEGPPEGPPQRPIPSPSDPPKRIVVGEDPALAEARKAVGKEVESVPRPTPPDKTTLHPEATPPPVVSVNGIHPHAEAIKVLRDQITSLQAAIKVLEDV